MTTSRQPILIQRRDQRFHTEAGWLDSRHSFSFGPHYDPANVGHGLLVVNNDDIVRAGTGFNTHPHRDMEIVTWVLDGELEHKDTTGHHGIIYPGLAQAMSAGHGIWHSEMNPSPTQDVHFVQMWVLPDTESVEPRYQQADITSELESGELVPIASGAGHDGAVSLHQKDAVLWGARLQPGANVSVPDNRHAHVYVARGSLELEAAGALTAGDAVRLTGAGSPRITAGGHGAEVLIWGTA